MEKRESGRKDSAGRETVKEDVRREDKRDTGIDTEVCVCTEVDWTDEGLMVVSVLKVTASWDTAALVVVARLVLASISDVV